MPARRTILLFALLATEVALVVMLRRMGWWATGGVIRWIACAVAAILPLAIAGLLLARNRWRFSLRAMMAAVALVALFLFLTLRPLYQFHTDRDGSKRLLAAGVQLSTEATYVDWYEQAGIDPRSPRPPVYDELLSPWLHPLAGEATAIPADHKVRAATLTNDYQIEVFVGEADRFPALEEINLWGNVTPAGLRRLQEALPDMRQVELAFVDRLRIPEGWFASLRNVRTLFALMDGWGAPPMSDVQLREIASLPNLQILTISGYRLSDAQLSILAESQSLRHVQLRHTGVTEAGVEVLKAVLPECEIVWD